MYFISSQLNLYLEYIYRHPLQPLYDDISVKEVGWVDMTLVYDTVYAATTGTAAVKDLAATKAAAGWCYPENIPANGAVYSKLYNWYATKLLTFTHQCGGIGFRQMRITHSYRQLWAVTR